MLQGKELIKRCKDRERIKKYLAIINSLGIPLFLT